MSVILQPQVSFPLVRQIANHLDSSTYYVRAVVRNAAGSIIDTLDLDAHGDQRYQTSWRVPADPSGQGAYVSVVTSVYVDSGYASKSPDYGDEETTYLIFDRVMPAMRGAGSGIDAYTVRRIIKEELRELPKPEEVTIPTPEALPPMRFEEVLTAIRAARADIAALPKPEAVNLAPVEKRLDQVLNAITEKPVTPATDLQPVVDELYGTTTTILEELHAMREDQKETKEELCAKIPEIVAGELQKTEFTAKTIEMRAEPRQKEEHKPRDLSKLFS